MVGSDLDLVGRGIMWWHSYKIHTFSLEILMIFSDRTWTWTSAAQFWLLPASATPRHPLTHHAAFSCPLAACRLWRSFRYCLNMRYQVIPFTISIAPEPPTDVSMQIGTENLKSTDSLP